MKKPRMDGLILTTSNRERRVGKKKGGGMKGENRHGQPTAVDRQKETLGHSKNNVLLRNEKKIKKQIDSRSFFFNVKGIRKPAHCRAV